MKMPHADQKTIPIICDVYVYVCVYVQENNNRFFIFFQSFIYIYTVYGVKEEEKEKEEEGVVGGTFVPKNSKWTVAELYAVRGRPSWGQSR